MDRDAWRLPRAALIEFVFRYRLGLRVERTKGCVRHRPQRWPARLRQTGWGGRLPQMTENLPYRHRCGDEADDAHLATAPRTQQGQHCIDAGEQQRPGVAGCLAVQWLGYYRGRWRGPRMRGRNGNGRNGVGACWLRQRGDCGAQR